MTKADAIAQMLRWLDEATINGNTTPADQIADLKERAAYLLDGAVKYVAGYFKIPAVHTVVRAPIKNLLGSGFGMFLGIPPDSYKAEADGAKSFYLEICGDVDIEMASGNATLYSESVTSTEEFTALKANIPSAAGGRVVMTASSDYPFVIRNVALYPCAFASDDDVQNYVAYIPYELPDDFREFDSIQQTADRHEYRRYPDYRREGLKTFLLPYDAAGQFDFHYWRNPADVPYSAADSTVLEVQAHAAQLIPLKLAVDVCLGASETAGIGHILDAKFQNMFVNLMVSDTGEKSVIEPVYTMM